MIITCQWCEKIADYRITVTAPEPFVVALCDNCAKEAAEMPIITEQDQVERLATANKRSSIVGR